MSFCDTFSQFTFQAVHDQRHQFCSIKTKRSFIFSTRTAQIEQMTPDEYQLIHLIVPLLSSLSTFIRKRAAVNNKFFQSNSARSSTGKKLMKIFGTTGGFVWKSWARVGDTSRGIYLLFAFVLVQASKGQTSIMGFLGKSDDAKCQIIPTLVQFYICR